MTDTIYDFAEPFELCLHCRKPIDQDSKLCTNCDYWAWQLPEIVLCDTCPTEQQGMERCNDADTLADFAEWCRMAGPGVDGLGTYPEAKVIAGCCLYCSVTQRLRAWICRDAGGGVVSALEILEKARALIAEPEHWTKGAMARDADGVVVFPLSRKAVSWCAVGAIDCVSRYRNRLAAIDVVSRATASPWGISAFNDNHAHFEVLNVFNVAIAAERAKAVTP